MLRRCADFVLLNKIDQLQPGGVDELLQIMRSLNPLAQVRICCWISTCIQP